MRRYPSLLLLIFVLSGIVVADLLSLPSWCFLLVTFSGLLGGVVALMGRRSVPALLWFGICLAGFAAFNFSNRYSDVGPNHANNIITKKRIFRIYGRVADWPELKPDRTEILVALDSLRAESVWRVEGGILIKVTDTTTALQRGDRVEFRGRIYPLPPSQKRSGFDYRRYLTLRGVSGIVYLPTLLDVRVDRRSRFAFLSHVDDLRTTIVSSLNRNLSPVAAALATGFLIGETRNIPPDIYRMFRDTGTMHLLAVSGSNVALVLMFIVVLLRPLALNFSRRAIVLLIAIAVFAVLSYGDPSVVRASVMATLVILARLLQRRLDLNNIIALTALIILLVEPAQLYDVGFQLSFVTAWGLIFIVPRFVGSSESQTGPYWRKWLYLPIIFSVVAQVCSTPIIAYYFGRIPLVSVAANLIVVPMVSVGVIGVLVLLIADLIFPLLGLLVGSLVNKLLLMVVWVLDQFGGEQTPVIELTGELPDVVTVSFTWLAYLLIVVVALSFQNRRARRLAVFMMILTVNVGLGFFVFLSGHDVRGWASFCKVPGGVATVVSRDGTGEADLILTGLSGKNYPMEERILQPLLNDLSITKLSSLFVLDANYGALDDIIRLAHLYRPSTLYIHQALGSGFSDVLARDSSGISAPAVSYFRETTGSIPDSGYYADDHGLWLCRPGSVLLFSSRIRARHFSTLPVPESPVLVLGELWRPSATDWILLRESGYRFIICSRVEQYFEEIAPDSDNTPDKVLPGFIVDLSRAGSFRLPLSK